MSTKNTVTNHKYTKMKNIAKAILAVMNEVSNIEKSMTVGSGSNSYKGVSDKDVKQKIGASMRQHGLCMIPIGVLPNTTVYNWDADYNGNKLRKQQVFTEVRTKYMLLHESGESIEVQGYGHGVDTQDKGAGKATTYALKNALLYTFLVPTGEIEDTDKQHSDYYSVPNPYQEWEDKISSICSLPELTVFYNQNKVTIDSDESIKILMSNRKNLLQNAK